MRKINYLLALLLVGIYGFAQTTYNVTFQVDMSQQTVGANGVHVAGNFQAAAGYPGDWNPSTAELLDPDADGIYELTVQLPAGSYEYKYINGNAWGSDELIPGGCAVNGNRGVTVNGDTTLTAFCFSLCYPCGGAVVTHNVTFQVDMNAQTVNANGVHVAGDFQADAGFPGNWNPGSTMLTDGDGDGIYEVTVSIPPGTYNYKYVNGNAWGQDESVPVGCAVSNNRQVVISGDTALPAYCYGTCNVLCTAPTYPVQFRVDMSTECNWDSVDVAGDFNSWGGTTNLLAQSGTPGVYATTLFLSNGIYGYKFRKYYNGSIVWESIANRSITVSGPVSTDITCFNSDSACGTSVAAADVTFRVDMSGQMVDPAGVFLIGDFTVPAWQPGAIQMTQDVSDPNIYETTVVGVCPTELRYKFVNGDPNNGSMEEGLDAADSACAEDNGIGGYNRYLMRSGSNETVSVQWEECVSCDAYGPTAVTPGNYVAQLSWNSSGASTYWVYFRNVSDSAFTRINSNNTSTVLRNRVPGDYEWYISDAGGANTSCISTFTTVCDDYNYSVNVFQIVDATGGKANVFAIDGGRRRWDIALIEGTDTTWATNRWSRFFRNLQPATYTVRVRDAYGCYSSQVDTFTINAIDSNTIPSLSAIDRPNGASGGVLRPIWSVADTSSIDRYQIRVKDMTTGGLGVLYNTYIAVGASATQYDVTGLPPARYRIDVRGRVNGVFSNGVYSNYRERIITSAKTDGASDAASSATTNSYPNPTSGLLHVAAPQGSDVVLMDLNGRIIAAQQVDQAEVRFDMSTLAQGVYLVRIQTDSEVYTERIVKE